MPVGRRTFLAAMLTVAAGALYGADNTLTSKQGGVCFREDDNHSPEKWEQLASVFERRGFKLCAALNLLRAAEEQFTHSIIVPEKAPVADIVLTLAGGKGRAVRISKLSLAGQP